MRGKLEGYTSQDGKMRNIPAYAGKTHWGCGLTGLPSEHPRVCGENPTDTEAHSIKAGTSPRMRGKHINHDFRSCRHRNIPAYAGKTRGWFGRQLLRWEHPRVCGENIASSFSVPSSAGTSPRMRGKPTNSDWMGTSIRNIPAYAGKTAQPTGCRRHRTEHPRVCGENAYRKCDGCFQ